MYAGLTAHGVVVAQIAANLPDDHGHGVGRKSHAQSRVEIVDGFHQADAAHLEQIVHHLAAVRWLMTRFRRMSIAACVSPLFTALL